MKVSYMLPSGTYNIILDKEDFEFLISRGIINIHTTGIPCKTGRGVWDDEEGKIVTLDKKEVFNDLRFMLHESVADMGEGSCNIQFVNIILDESLGFGLKGEEKNEENLSSSGYAE